MKEIDLKDLSFNPSIEIGENFMLISAGNKTKSNSMTASWGSIGALWGKGIKGKGTTTIYVRPSRYTDKFIDENEYYSLCFFPDEYKDDLLYMGAHSGRDENKLSHTKLTLDFIDNVPIYKEAKLIFICRKLYKGKITKEGFIDKTVLDTYYKEDSAHIYNNASMHNVYVGEITKVFIK